MKKKISLPVMAVSAILLLGGCGTQMYDLSEDEENLVVQYSAHILAKYNIEQKDGMTAASSEETQETQKQDSQMPESQNTQSADTTWRQMPREKPRHRRWRRCRSPRQSDMHRV